jgi:hypothetical protein
MQIKICISQMTNDVEHFFIYLLSTHTSFENCLSNSFSHLLIRLFILLVFSFLNSFYILHINPLLDVYSCQRVFSHSAGCLFTLIIVSFAVQKLFNLVQFQIK